MYEVDEEALATLDEFEGVHLNIYSGIEIKARDAEDNIHSLRTYVLEDFNPNLLHNDAILFDNYTEKNPFFGGYLHRSKDPSFSLDEYIKQIKRATQ